MWAGLQGSCLMLRKPSTSDNTLGLQLSLLVLERLASLDRCHLRSVPAALRHVLCAMPRCHSAEQQAQHGAVWQRPGLQAGAQCIAKSSQQLDGPTELGTVSLKHISILQFTSSCTWQQTTKRVKSISKA